MLILFYGYYVYEMLPLKTEIISFKDSGWINDLI